MIYLKRLKIMSDFDFIVLALFVSQVLTVFSTIMVASLSSQVFLSIPYYKHFRDNQKTEKLLLEAAKFYYEELGIENTPTINFHFKFPKSYKIWHGFAGEHKKKPNTYEVIILMNRNKYELLSTVAHEMIHVKQMANGEFRVDEKTKRKYWKDVDHTHTKYSKQPWENEAFENETKLAKKFIKHKRMKFGCLLMTLNKLWLSI